MNREIFFKYYGPRSVKTARSDDDAFQLHFYTRERITEICECDDVSDDFARLRILSDYKPVDMSDSEVDRLFLGLR